MWEMSILSHYKRTGGLPDFKQYLSNEVPIEILSKCFLECVQQYQSPWVPQEQKDRKNYVFLVYKVVTHWFGYSI